jgi:urease beta subunit
MQLSIKTNFPDVQRQLKELSEGIGNRATASALNKVVAQAKTAMSREIRAEFVLPASKVNESLRISRARASGIRYSMEATLSSISKPGRRGLNLIHFQARQTATGVSFKVRKNGPRKTIPGAFIANGGRTVFIRTGKKRLPIKALTTVDQQGMFNTKRINARVIAMIEAKFPVIFANEVRFFTERFKGGKA